MAPSLQASKNRLTASAWRVGSAYCSAQPCKAHCLPCDPRAAGAGTECSLTWVSRAASPVPQVRQRVRRLPGRADLHGQHLGRGRLRRGERGQPGPAAVRVRCRVRSGGAARRGHVPATGAAAALAGPRLDPGAQRGHATRNRPAVPQPPRRRRRACRGRQHVQAADADPEHAGHERPAQPQQVPGVQSPGAAV